MEMNWFIIGIVLAAAVLLVLFFIKRNLKDKKELEEQWNKPSKPAEDGREPETGEENGL